MWQLAGWLLAMLACNRNKCCITWPSPVCALTSTIVPVRYLHHRRCQGQQLCLGLGQITMYLSLGTHHFAMAGFMLLQGMHVRLTPSAPPPSG